MMAKKFKSNLFLSATKPPAPISDFFLTNVYQNSKMFDKLCAKKIQLKPLFFSHKTACAHIYLFL
jgi:hypothetical protein